jgi:hypothetical protein
MGAGLSEENIGINRQGDTADERLHTIDKMKTAV